MNWQVEIMALGSLEVGDLTLQIMTVEIADLKLGSLHTHFLDPEIWMRMKWMNWM
jgi:hypothetical protein